MWKWQIKPELLLLLLNFQRLTNPSKMIGTIFYDFKFEDITIYTNWNCFKSYCNVDTLPGCRHSRERMILMNHDNTETWPTRIQDCERGPRHDLSREPKNNNFFKKIIFLRSKIKSEASLPLQFANLKLTINLIRACHPSIFRFLTILYKRGGCKVKNIPG